LDVCFHVQFETADQMFVLCLLNMYGILKRTAESNLCVCVCVYVCVCVSVFVCVTVWEFNAESSRPLQLNLIAVGSDVFTSTESIHWPSLSPTDCDAKRKTALCPRRVLLVLHSVYLTIIPYILFLPFFFLSLVFFLVYLFFV